MFSVKFFILAVLVAVTSAFAPMGARFSSKALFANPNEKAVMPPTAGAKDSKVSTNVVQTAAGSPDFKTLVAAVTACKLDGVLSGAGPFTVFAPTDAAFAKLPAGTVDGLLKDIPKLTNILKFHVSSNQQRPNRNGRTYASLLDDKELGIRVTVDTAESFVLHGKPNKAKVCSTIQCSNGFIHVIDEVLIPYEGSVPPSMILKNTDDAALHN